jgi:DNA-binding NtrC family response regulator
LVKSQLEPDGHAVTSITSVTGAFAAFDAGENFDLYIFGVDMSWREPHGLSLAKMFELRNPTAAIIFSTEDPSMTTRPELAKWAVFPKPLDFDACAVLSLRCLRACGRADKR